MTEAMEAKMIQCIAHYRAMEEMNSILLIEVKDQYEDMAQGGQGGYIGIQDENGDYIQCREYNYPGYPDSFFQEIRDLMGWQ
tara:strand:- start:317 stop:562 length:246 start_codon:yes stop_codon:yes gene_type:complete